MSLRHLSSGDDTRRAAVLRVVLILPMLFGLVFVPINLLQDRRALALAEVGMMIYAGVIYGLLGRGLSLRSATWAYLVPFLSVLVFALATAANVSVFVWALVIPLVSHRLLGRRDGSIVGLVFLALAAALMLLRFGFAPTVVEWAEMSDVLLCAAALFAISLAHETEITRADHQLRQRADLDSLTHLVSRARFRELFDQARRAARRGEPGAPTRVSMVLVDLDHFKSINDRYGHDIGDIVLEAVAMRLLHQCREVDILGRVGGEEMAILLFDLDHADAVQQAERLRQTVAEPPVAARDHAVAVTMSLGVASFSLAGHSFEEIFAEADARMYQAKREGRDRTQSQPVAPQARQQRLLEPSPERRD